jgi:hypothetical protein
MTLTVKLFLFKVKTGLHVLDRKMSQLTKVIGDETSATASTMIYNGHFTGQNKKISCKHEILSKIKVVI